MSYQRWTEGDAYVIAIQGGFDCVWCGNQIFPTYQTIIEHLERAHNDSATALDLLRSEAELVGLDKNFEDYWRSEAAVRRGEPAAEMSMSDKHFAPEGPTDAQVSEHTPGPWAWHGDDNDLVAPALYAKWLESNYDARFWPFVLQGEWHNDSTAGIRCENDANRNLIASAPDLLTESTRLRAQLAQQAQLEICICAAVQAEEGIVIRGHRHHDAMRAARLAFCTVKQGEDAQGFITSRGRYVTRREGRQLQEAADIGSYSSGGYRGDLLFSEDLY